MNKFFNNFSKYLLIASLGFASTQVAGADEELKGNCTDTCPKCSGKGY